MTARAMLRLPDLTGPLPTIAAVGWMALAVETDPVPGGPRCAVPSLDDARRAARPVIEETDPCAPRVLSFDPPDGTTLIAVGPEGASVTARVVPALSRDRIPTLIRRRVTDPLDEVIIEGQAVDPCRERLVFEGVFTPSLLDGDYELLLDGYDHSPVRISIALTAPAAAQVALDPRAITLSPTTISVGLSVASPPADWPRPPLLGVDRHGCTVAAWSVSERGSLLVPHGEQRVDLLQSCRGGIVATLTPARPVLDAMFWGDVIAVLTPNDVFLYDMGGCPIGAGSFATGFTDAVALAISDEGWLMAVQRGATPNVVLVRRDGSRALTPAAVSGRGYYARHRSPALVFDEASCAYAFDPAQIGRGCCVEPRRLLTAEEALFFRLVDDLPDLRRRVAYPTSGQVILGPAEPGDPLDSGRPGTRWHRVLVFGEIPEGCAVSVETRAFDDLSAGDPLNDQGWSTPVVASQASRGPVEAPFDARAAAADTMVLAGPGRFLWIRLTLEGDGLSTPRITSIEIERTSEEAIRFLPKVFRDSTPEDDFLRRWLALFETTIWRGVAGRLDAHADLFDPRIAPAEMLPFLAAWLEIPLLGRARSDSERLRFILLHAPELARTRGTVDGIVLAVRLYMDITVQIVESFRSRSRFILGSGPTMGCVTGPVLGCDTIMSAERPPTYLGDEPLLGRSFLLACDERSGTAPHHFDVLVPARAVCASEELALLQAIIEMEKPAHTSFSIRQIAPAGWVIGAASIVGQEVTRDFDRRTLDPATYGIAIMNGSPRPKPIGEGFALGHDSRLASAEGEPAFRLDATVGKTTRLGA